MRTDVSTDVSTDVTYDDLSGPQQTVVRIKWDQQMAAIREALDLAAEFEAQGVTDWVAAAPDGSVTIGRAQPADPSSQFIGLEASDG